MGILEALQRSIHGIGIKEIARRSGLAASTVSRVNAGLLHPSLDVAEKISKAAGLEISISPVNGRPLDHIPRLKKTLETLRAMRKLLRKFGVKHVIVFGSVARGEDRPESDLDLYVDFGESRVDARIVLPAEGRILDAFPGQKIDFVTTLTTVKGRRLKMQIEKDGRRAF